MSLYSFQNYISLNVQNHPLVIMSVSFSILDLNWNFEIFFICIQSKKLKRELMLKLEIISKTWLNFMIVIIVYE